MRLLQGFVLGVLLTLLGYVLSGTVAAQDAIQVFGTLSGAPKALAVDAQGNLNVAGN